MKNNEIKDIKVDDFLEYLDKNGDSAKVINIEKQQRPITIIIDEELAINFKDYCIKHGVKQKKVIADIIYTFLKFKGYYD